MNHEKYLQLTWREKNERIGKIIHLFQNVEAAFDEMNNLIKIADECDVFKDVDFFPPTQIIPTTNDTYISTNTNEV